MRARRASTGTRWRFARYEQKTFRALLLQRLDAGSGITKGEVFYYLGEICMKQGDKAKAVQMLERAVENEPSLTRAKTMLTELKG